MSQSDDASELDAICVAFEKAWCDSQETPELVNFLDMSEKRVRKDLLKLLVPIDLAYRKRRSLPCDADYYTQHFPDYSSTVVEILGYGQTRSIEKRGAAGGKQAVRITANKASLGERAKIGRYTVLQMLDRGGQGTVYRAAHPALPIEVAIKVAHRKPSLQVRQAMQDEANVLCELEHANVARVRDLELDENGRPYLVLDFVRGRSMQQLLNSGEAPLEKAVRWLADAADGVAYCHSRGVLHLDLKPGNIVVDEQGTAKVIDFGLATYRHAWSDQETEPDRIAGTPEFMAPEQASGEASGKTASADVFALGAILYRLLTGSPPFAATTHKTPLERSRNYDLDLDALDDADAPAPLIAACRRALQRDPAERFESAEHFADAIRHAVEPHADRRWVVTAVIAGVLVIAGATWQWPRAASPNLGSTLIDRFTVSHIGNTATDAEFEAALLEIRPPREHDDIALNAVFKTPVFCFLVWLNPDGSQQLCYPESRATIQSEPIGNLVFPSDLESAFRLTDGPGQQAFVLFASLESLPSFDDWNSAIDDTTWPDPENVGNWEYTEGRLRPLVSDGHNGGRTRGEIVKKRMPESFKRMCDQLYVKNSTDVRGVVFEVQPQ